MSSRSSRTMRTRSVATLIIGAVTGATARTSWPVVEQASRSRRNLNSANSCRCSATWLSSRWSPRRRMGTPAAKPLGRVPGWFDLVCGPDTALAPQRLCSGELVAEMTARLRKAEGRPSLYVRRANFAAQATESCSSVALASPPLISGTIKSSSATTWSRSTEYSSRSRVVPAGAKVNCWRTMSASLSAPLARHRKTNSCVRACADSSNVNAIRASRTGCRKSNRMD